MSYTPGPWMVKHAGSQDEIWSMRGLVAELSLYPSGSRAVGANSKLISAAPELLEALETLRPYVESIASADECAAKDLAVVDAAIKKARGE